MNRDSKDRVREQVLRRLTAAAARVRALTALVRERTSRRWRETARDATVFWAAFQRQSAAWSRGLKRLTAKADHYLETHVGTALTAFWAAGGREWRQYRHEVEPRLSPWAKKAFAVTSGGVNRLLGPSLAIPRFRQTAVATISGIMVVALVVVGASSIPRDYARKPIPQVPLPPRPQAPPVTPPAQLVKAYSAEPVISIYIDALGATIWLPMEAYLVGVLGGEMDTRAPVEAFAAQAIIARTVALKAMVEKGTPYQLHHTDVCTSPTHLQAYRPSVATADMKRAVQMTRGQVLMYGDELVSAVFASCCGGRTADVQESYPSEVALPYLKSVPCPCGEFAPDVEYRWRGKLPLWAVGSFLGRATWTMEDLRITGRGTSGRVTQLTAGGKTLKGADLRAIYGEVVRSTLVDTFYVSGSYAYATGRGWGHGVGMCQWGAFTLAKKGMKAADICSYYYQGAGIVKLWK